MTERTLQYGKVLFELGLDRGCIQKAQAILMEHKVLLEALDNPSVKMEEKHGVIDKLFDESIRGFLKVVTDNQMICQIEEIFEAYYQCVIAEKNWVKATFYYVTKPSEEQIDKIKQKICSEYKKDGVELELVEKPSLIGGFVLKVDDFEIDRSIQGTLEHLKQNLVRR